MNQRLRILPLVLVMLMAGAGTTIAQEVDCPLLVQKSLSIADQACSGLGRNQACYGNITLKVVPQLDIPSLEFQSPGDKISIADIRSLELASLNMAAGVWGIALMNIQANIPDTLPGQGVTFLLFGDVQITNAADTSATTLTMLPITASNSVNIRSGPSRNVAVVGSLRGGQTAQADGRNQSGDWLRIQLPDGGNGWVFTELVRTDGDPSTLPVVDAIGTTNTDRSQPVYGPMQVFYLRTGLGDRPCEQAPDSGILIQTSAGAGGVELVMNGVKVSLESTIYVQAQPSRDMIISVIEGRAIISAAEKSIIVPAGAKVVVPMDADLNPAGAPGDPQAYDGAALAALPVELLPQNITAAPALTPDQLATLSLPVTIGRYRFTASDGNPPEVVWCAMFVAHSTEFSLQNGPSGGHVFGQYVQPALQMVSVPGVGEVPSSTLDLPLVMLWYAFSITEGLGSHINASFSKLSEFPSTMYPPGMSVANFLGGGPGTLDGAGITADIDILMNGAEGTLHQQICTQAFTIERIGD